MKQYNKQSILKRYTAITNTYHMHCNNSTFYLLAMNGMMKWRWNAMTSDSLKLQKILLLVLNFIVASSQSDASSSNYYSVSPTWYVCDEQKQCNCSGGKDYNDRVMCDNENLRSAILSCNCVTYDIKTKSTSVGSCYYNCAYDERDAYTWLPQNPEALINGSVCTRFNRTGSLCSDCQEEHSPLVLSYNLSCVRCPDGHKNWWKFFIVGFLPLKRSSISLLYSLTSM